MPQGADQEHIRRVCNKISRHLEREPYALCLNVLATMLVVGLMHEGRDNYIETAEDRRDACLYLSKFFADKAVEAMN
jgi:hypothetical protein